MGISRTPSIPSLPWEQPGYQAPATKAASGLTPWQKFGMGTAAGGMLGGGLANMFMDQQDPMAAASPYLEKIPGIAHEYLDPYSQVGKETIPVLQQQLGQLLNDPGALMGRLGAGFQQSPGYQWQKQQGEQAIANAMAAGGMAGSPMHGQQAGQLAENLANQDYYNYLGKVLGLYGTGFAGTQGLEQQGLQAGGDLAGILASNLMNQANLAYGGAQAQNAAQAQGMSDLFSGLGSIASLAMML